MLSDEKRNKFFELLKDSSKDEWVWMNGYLSALVMPLDGPIPLKSITNDMSERIVTSSVPTTVLAPAVPATLQVTVVYGTETGNSKKLATGLVKKLKDAGHKATLKNTETYKASELDQEKNLIVVVSTHGDGEPPAAAKNFLEILKNKTSKFKKLNFAVIGLGDTSYPLFCQTGVDVDSLLFGLGGTRIQEVAKCDLDIDTTASPWIDLLLSNLSQLGEKNGEVTAKATENKTTTNKRIIYTGKVTTNLVLNDIGSTKSTRHIEIESDASILYLPGDSAGFIPQNKEEEVNQILSLLKIGPEERVSHAGETWMAKDLLLTKLSIRNLPDRVIKKYADFVKTDIPTTRFDLDVLLSDFPLPSGTNAGQVFAILENMVPRYYSIASSPSAHGEHAIHLTVAEVAIETKTGVKEGLCSGYLSNFTVGEEVLFFIQKNDNFRLPPDDASLIMIGPGTGIAPFRSFLMERDAASASGKNWLFFGERNFVSDFYYQAELLQLMETGILQKLNAAFSRDTKNKVYVQDRMLENASELLKWIEEGAYIYVCGSKDPMSKDVEKQLLQILSAREFETNLSAEDYLSSLEESGRYKKDVY
ncbi:sulfite reductase flavoprotein subunit alpha [Leptospira ognonensis]|uniref:assimilatory sulfite reductase (NADPH) n=1 Tax=Leptospira ognonensis TaxID=2484945 RepID=A0A4R9JW87_9LEPT|nr:flavodoxin domain-containing protein [Leptospira ognonensis]TGL56636.1 sulfite reductase flavoprotein subunit alpha [Leptospira ognonensis]